VSETEDWGRISEDRLSLYKERKTETSEPILTPEQKLPPYLEEKIIDIRRYLKFQGAVSHIFDTLTSSSPLERLLCPLVCAGFM